MDLLLKISRFFIALLLCHGLLILLVFALCGELEALVALALLGPFFLLAWILASHLLMGQIAAKMASFSTHLGDFLDLEAISRQSGVRLPALYVYDSRQINCYLVKGPWGPPALAISTECFLALSREERAEIYRYQMTRLQFPLHLSVDTGVSLLLLLWIYLIDLLFLPINIVRVRLLAIANSPWQQVFKLISLPLINLSKNIILGKEKHSYLRPILGQRASQQRLISIYYKVRQSFLETGLEYDFLSCNGFMGFESDLFNLSTEGVGPKNYAWIEK